MKVTKKLFATLLCLTLLLGLIPGGVVRGQNPNPTVYFSPDPAFVYLDGTNNVSIDLMLKDVVNLNAFDVKFEWDPSIVSMQSFDYSLEEFLTDLFCFEWVGTSSLRLSCTQLDEPAKTGTGPLVRIVFSGLVEGVTQLNLTKAELFRKSGTEITPVASIDGTLKVVDPTNFIYLPLIMSVSVQGVLNRGGIGVALARGLNYGMGPYSGTSANTLGNNLTCPNVVADSYRITTSHPRVLNVSADLNKTFTPATGANTVPALRLVAGNAVWTDNEINLSDYTAVCGAYGNPSLNEDADVNFDGKVDLRDLALVIGNWGLTSTTAYAAWLP